MHRIPRTLLLLSALALLVACEEPVPGEDWDDDGLFAIMGALVFASPYTDPIEDGVVIVLDGVIEAVGARGEVQVPPGASRVNAGGLSVLAGFWNADVWIEDELLDLAEGGTDEELSLALRERFTRYGFTTVVDVGSSAAELQALTGRISSGAVRGPNVLGLGGALPAGIHQSGWWHGMEGEQVSLTGMPVGDVALVPSLTLASYPGESEAPESAARRISDGVDAVADHLAGGGVLVFGTGAGYVPEYDPAGEFTLLDEAGASFVQLLEALTSEASQRFDQGYAGFVQPGMTADLTLVDGDPSADPTALTRVRWVIRDGYTVFSAM
jgi:imidazolonepropionase-like amidohydrolase